MAGESHPLKRRNNLWNILFWEMFDIYSKLQDSHERYAYIIASQTVGRMLYKISV